MPKVSLRLVYTIIIFLLLIITVILVWFLWGKEFYQRNNYAGGIEANVIIWNPYENILEVEYKQGIYVEKTKFKIDPFINKILIDPIKGENDTTVYTRVTNQGDTDWFNAFCENDKIILASYETNFSKKTFSEGLNYLKSATIINLGTRLCK